MIHWRRWQSSWIHVNWWWCIGRRHSWWRVVLMKATKEATLATCIKTTIICKGRVTLVVFGAYSNKKETKEEKCHHHHQPQGYLAYQLPIQLPHLFFSLSLSLSLSLSPLPLRKKGYVYMNVYIHLSI